MCSFDSPSLEAETDERHCDRACSGGSGPECGDRSHYNVFATGARTSRVAGDRYLGCYDEGSEHHESERKKSTSIDRHSHNTPKLCSKYCDAAGFGYYGLTDGRTCWCGNALPENRSRVGDEKCSVQCSGNANKYCGGISETAWFRIGRRPSLLSVLSCVSTVDDRDDTVLTTNFIRTPKKYSFGQFFFFSQRKTYHPNGVFSVVFYATRFLDPFCF